MEELKYLIQSEKELLFQEIYNDQTKHRKRNIAIFEVALYCALRASEVSILSIQNYNRITHEMRCRRLKGSKSNTLKIVDEYVIKALDDYLEERLSMDTTNNALFISQKGTPISRQRLDALMKQYCEKAKFIPEDKWHMHVLKHTRGIDLAEQEIDLYDIQFWLGHKNIQNTLIYLDHTTVLKRRLFNNLASLEGGNYKNRY